MLQENFRKKSEPRIIERLWIKLDNILKRKCQLSGKKKTLNVKDKKKHRGVGWNILSRVIC